MSGVRMPASITRPPDGRASMARPAPTEGRAGPGRGRRGQAERPERQHQDDDDRHDAPAISAGDHRVGRGSASATGPMVGPGGGSPSG